jgi:hypothetical protein
LRPPITAAALKPLRDHAQRGWRLCGPSAPDPSATPTSKSSEREKSLSWKDAGPRIPLDIGVNLIESRRNEAAGIVDRTPRLQPKSETSGFAKNLPGAPDREDGSWISKIGPCRGPLFRRQ